MTASCEPTIAPAVAELTQSSVCRTSLVSSFAERKATPAMVTLPAIAAMLWEKSRLSW